MVDVCLQAALQTDRCEGDEDENDPRLQLYFSKAAQNLTKTQDLA